MFLSPHRHDRDVHLAPADNRCSCHGVRHVRLQVHVDGLHCDWCALGRHARMGHQSGTASFSCAVSTFLAQASTLNHADTNLRDLSLPVFLICVSHLNALACSNIGVK